MEPFDAIVIGSGQGGDPLARVFAAAGRKTALIEREHVGGTCINTGCTPTKTMVASARAAYLARRGADFGVRTGPVSVDMKAVRARKRQIVGEFRSSSETSDINTKNLELIKEKASFVGLRTIAVGSRTLQAPIVVIDTGCRPSIPAFKGLETVPYLDNESAMELDIVPEHLVVVGGGYIGLEFSQMFRRFGSMVTLIHRGPRLIEREDDDISDAIAEIFRQDGIGVELNSEIAEVSRSPKGVTVELAGGKKVEGTHLLLALGRSPNTGELDLKAGGVEADERGFIKVNDRLETNVPGVYAIGDVNGGPQFTHISYDDYRILRDNLLQGGNRSRKDRPVPYTLFIDPQLGRIGLSERDAKAQNLEYRLARLNMTSVARALEMDESRGFIKALVDPKTDKILGAAVLAVEGGEIASMIQIAMMGGMSFKSLREGVFSHPTLSESINRLFDLA